MISEPTLASVFNESQFSTHSHPKLLKQIQHLHSKSDADEFEEEFIKLLQCLLVVYEREANIERALNFAVKFLTLKVDKENKPDKQNGTDVTSQEEEEEELINSKLLMVVFDFLLLHHNDWPKSVRFRCCQLINKLLTGLGEEAHIEDELYDQIYQGMLSRLKDKFPVVREQAVMALTRLQDPTDVDCPVIKAFNFLMSCDPSWRVRHTIVGCVAATSVTLPHVLERTRDSVIAVRRKAYEVLGAKVHIRALTIAERLRVLKTGLNDSEESVRDACVKKLLTRWLACLKGDVLSLIKSLDVEGCPDLTEKAVLALFQQTAHDDLLTSFTLLNEHRVVEEERLDVESAFYWRCLVQHVTSCSEADGDKLLPTAAHLSQYIHRCLKRLDECSDVELKFQLELVLQQVVQLASFLDLSDQATRVSVEKLLTSLVVQLSVPDSVLNHVCQLAEKLYTNETRRIEALTELIAEIQCPTQSRYTEQEIRERDIRLCQIRVSLVEMTSELEECVKNKEFGRAEQLQNQISELTEQRNELLEENDTKPLPSQHPEQMDSTLVHRCLCVAACLLRSIKRSTLAGPLLMLCESLILPSIQNPKPAVRREALLCLGLSCLLDKNHSLKYIFLLVQACEFDCERVQNTALCCVFDVLLLYGLEAFSSDTPPPERSNQDLDQSTFMTTSRDENIAKNVVGLLAAKLDTQSKETRAVVVEGLCKLLLHGRIVSAKLLTRIILLWLNPVVTEDVLVKSILAKFLPLFAFCRREHQELLSECYVPVVDTVLTAPLSSPLSSVNDTTILNLLVPLTNARSLIENKESMHLEHLPQPAQMSLAFRLCNSVLSAPDGPCVRTWAKTLCQLELSSADPTTLRDLYVLARKISAVGVESDVAVRSFNKFETFLSDLLESSGCEVPSDDVIADTQTPQLPTNILDAMDSEPAPVTSPEQRVTEATLLEPDVGFTRSYIRRKTHLTSGARLDSSVSQSSDTCESPTHVNSVPETPVTSQMSRESTQSPRPRRAIKRKSVSSPDTGNTTRAARSTLHELDSNSSQ